MAGLPNTSRECALGMFLPSSHTVTHVEGILKPRNSLFGIKLPGQDYVSQQICWSNFIQEYSPTMLL